MMLRLLEKTGRSSRALTVVEAASHSPDSLVALAREALTPLEKRVKGVPLRRLTPLHRSLWLPNCEGTEFAFGREPVLHGE
jgi:hypothetical protein